MRVFNYSRTSSCIMQKLHYTIAYNPLYISRTFEFLLSNDANIYPLPPQIAAQFYTFMSEVRHIPGCQIKYFRYSKIFTFVRSVSMTITSIRLFPLRLASMKIFLQDVTTVLSRAGIITSVSLSFWPYSTYIAFVDLGKAFAIVKWSQLFEIY